MFSKVLFFILLSVALVGCATAPRQTEAFLKETRSIPDQQKLTNVPFVVQKTNYCGPASLAMVMGWAGRNVSLDQLGEDVFTPGLNGTLQADMLSTVRRHALLALPVGGIKDLLTELAAGNPVVVLQNLGLKFAPQWHYAVAVGYDLNKLDIILHSGPNKYERMKLKNFEPTWELGNFWGMIVMPPGKLSATADDMAHAEAASFLEASGQLNAAAATYRAVLEKWPKSLTALLGMGNISYTRGRFDDAVDYLRQATSVYPQEPMAWHNLALAQQSAGELPDAKLSAKKAIELERDPATRETYRANLKDLL